MRESDLVVMVCTPALGKVPCAARGARKSKRRFPGGLPVGARGDARVSRGRGSLWTLEGFSATADHASLGRDLERFAFANYLCELSDRLTVDLDPDRVLFEALWASLDHLMEHGGDPLGLRAYELRLLASIGSLPDLDGCAACGSPLGDGPVPFDPQRGGALCARHGGASPRIDGEVFALARALLAPAGERAVAADPRATRARRRQLRDLCVSLLQPHLSRPLRSTAFFAELERLGAGGGLSMAAEGRRDAAASRSFEPGLDEPDEESGKGPAGA